MDPDNIDGRPGKTSVVVVVVGAGGGVVVVAVVELDEHENHGAGDRGFDCVVVDPRDALHSLRANLNDPNNVLQSWDPTLINPCTWYHVTCNSDNSVVRVDLGNAALSGQLVAQLGRLRNLQYLELYSNNISGTIPSDLGNLRSLVSLDLYLNNFSGHIPDSLGKLKKLRFLYDYILDLCGLSLESVAIDWIVSMRECILVGFIQVLVKCAAKTEKNLRVDSRLNNNRLTGSIPMSLTNIAALRVLDLSNNRLSGPVPDNGSFSLFTPISFANNRALCGPVTGKPCPGSPPFSPPPPFVPPPPVSSPVVVVVVVVGACGGVAVVAVVELDEHENHGAGDRGFDCDVVDPRFASVRGDLCEHGSCLDMLLDAIDLKFESGEPSDALHSLRANLNDPNNVLQSWDPTLINPCTWYHVTCNSDNSVVRVDLGNAALSGQLVAQLGRLRNLQYLELYSNNISGTIPSDLGNLKSLVSLDLYLNKFSGHIPDSLGKLNKLRFLYDYILDLCDSRLNNNRLTGSIPMSLTNIAALRVLDLSNNRLSGPVPDNGSFSLFTPISFANNRALCGPVTGKPCPGSPPFSPPPPFVPPPPVSSPGRLSDPNEIGAVTKLIR
ncbi:hypothetical protein Syun_013687 [Stephania yunnanensis]|uniref:Leucine-rich repeat-containing N-terminal plant-type domain-containing protein n=1 Tax=Stephania yunnanensis TaxID=152371 RepID=A0AAP0JK43_9MAGN